MAGALSLSVQRHRFLIAVPVVGVLALAFAGLLAPWLPLDVRQSASALGLLLAGLLAALSCGQRAAQTTGQRRQSWLLLTSAAVVAIAGNVWVVVVGADPVTSPSTVGNASIAAALLLSIVGLLRFPTVRRRGVDQLLMVLDGVVAASAVLVVASVLVYAELLDDLHGDLVTQVSTLLFPVLDVILATVALLLILRTSGTDRSAFALVSAGFLTYAVADLSFAVLAAQDRFHFGTLLDLGWIGGYLLIGLAAWYPNEREGEAAPPSLSGSSDARGTVLLFGVLLTAGVVQVGFGPGGRLSLPQALLWLALLLAAGLRQLLLAVDNAALRRGLERRVAEQTADLRRLVRQTEVLLTSVDDGIYGVDPGGRITFVNPSGARALGTSTDRLLGESAHDRFHAPDVDGQSFPYTGCYIHDAISGGTVASAEEDVYVRADGSTFPVEITASPLIDEDRVRGAVVVFRDVTHRREVDRMKDEFLSVVSHELRTPLTSIRGSLGLLSSGRLGDLSARADSLVRLALQNSERLSRLINDLLDLERLEGGHRPLEVSAHAGAQLLRTAVGSVAGLASAGQVRVEVGECTGTVLADEDLVVQTLTNLLGNALKYSPPGGTVQAGCTDRGDYVVFSVSDHGRGIPEDKLESVFGRFQQVDSSDSRQMGGSGLGLAISRGIVERLGGRIWAESELGAGTTVRFTLPAASSTPTDPVVIPPPRPESGRRRVLVVGADDRSRAAAHLLGAAGLDVFAADTADEAEVKAAELRPQAVSVDVDVPGIHELLAVWTASEEPQPALVLHSGDGPDPARADESRTGQTSTLSADLIRVRPSAEQLRRAVLDVLDHASERRQGHTRGHG